jgi:hypothetical protein
MAEPSTEIICAWVDSIGQADGWRRIRDVVTEVLQVKWRGHSIEDCEALAEDRERYIAEELRNRIARAIALGQANAVEVDAEDPYLRRVASPYDGEIANLRNMDPYKFEEFCKDVLKKIGADAAVTQKIDDGGVDFHGTGIRIGPLACPFPLHACVAVIGQAKRYGEDHLVTLNEVRQFVGASVRFIAEFRARTTIPWVGPVLLAFWTTSSFHSAALEYAQSLGVWTVDGRALVRLAGESGLLENAEEKLESVNSK